MIVQTSVQTSYHSRRLTVLIVIKRSCKKENNLWNSFNPRGKVKRLLGIIITKNCFNRNSTELMDVHGIRESLVTLVRKAEWHKLYQTTFLKSYYSPWHIINYMVLFIGLPGPWSPWTPLQSGYTSTQNQFKTYFSII